MNAIARRRLEHIASDRPWISSKDIDRFWSKVAKSDEPCGCWIYQGRQGTNGYGVFSLHDRPLSAHRVAFAIVNGPIAEGLVICHTCDVRMCVKPLHLFAGTYADNEHDKMAKGRQANGERQGLSVLTEVEVRSLRRLAGSQSTRALARLFKVSQTTVRDVLTGRTWGHLE